MKLELETDRFVFILEGPDRESRWISAVPASVPQLKVAASGCTVASLRSAGSDLPLNASGQYEGSGPALSEQTAYRITLRAKGAESLQLAHRDVALVAPVRPIAGLPSVLSGTVNFASQIGLSRFVVVGSDFTSTIEVEVRPTKLDYDLDYAELRSDVEGTARQLALEYLRSTYGGGHVGSPQASTSLDWLLLLRHEIENLKRGLAHIESHPFLVLDRDVEYVRADRIHRSSSATRRAVARGRGEGPWIQSNLGAHRSRLPAISPRETLDTPEHRWIRQQLIDATRSLADLKARAIPRRAGAIPTVRAQQIADELREMEESLAGHLSGEVLSTARGEISADFSSLVLQGRPGYREVYQSLLRLRMTTLVGGDALELPLRDLASLYEIWCFIKCVALVGEILETPVNVHDLIELRDRGTQLQLVPGRRSRVELQLGNDKVVLIFNQRYATDTFGQKPDIAIQIERLGLPPVVLVMDAKYRLETSPDYLSAYGTPGPPIDAIGQLHRYRDAIVVSPAGSRGRPVVRAVALFPLAAVDSTHWSSHALYRSIGSVGIGALPFLPSNLSWVRDWLAEALTAPDRDLAWPGPPFLAWDATS